MHVFNVKGTVLLKTLRKLKATFTGYRVGKVVKVQDDVISGTLSTSTKACFPEFLDLYIGETQVSRAPLVGGNGGPLTFRFGVYDIWRFAQRTDPISVRFKGKNLLMPNGELVIYPRRNGK